MNYAPRIIRGGVILFPVSYFFLLFPAIGSIAAPARRVIAENAIGAPVGGVSGAFPPFAALPGIGFLPERKTKLSYSPSLIAVKVKVRLLTNGIFPFLSE